MTTLTIPPGVLPRLREGTRPVIVDLGTELEVAADDPATFRELRPSLEAQWALLDVIGWSDEADTSEPIELDAHAHSAAMLAALEAILPMLAEWLAETAEDDPSKPAKRDEYAAVREFDALVRALGARTAHPSTDEGA